MSSKVLTILHFNDVYNVEERTSEPVGGAARFSSALKSFRSDNPLILFSGDIIAPSTMSTFTKGDQMIPVLNRFGVHCSCLGNHDFDFGLDVLTNFMKKTDTPWLMSNVIDNETNAPLAGGEVTHMIEWDGLKIGVIGLVEVEWLETLATINPSEVTFIDFVEQGHALACQLRDEGADYIIALTHMRTPNDLRLAEEVSEIDLILGGHDHVYLVEKVNGRLVIKSGTDFQHFSKICVDFNNNKEVSVTKVEVDSSFPRDEDLVNDLMQYTSIIEKKMDESLGYFSTDLDGLFSSVRTKETNLGNFVCDVMLAATRADIAFINSGTLRSDRIHKAGEFKMRDLMTILPMLDNMVVLRATGTQLIDILENGVSQYPKLEGRFPQVGGLSFAFDPSKPPGQRIDPRFIRVGDEYLKKDSTYDIVTKEYLQLGKDGYDTFRKTQLIADSEQCPQLMTALQNHFLSIRMMKNHYNSSHRQSLVTLSRRHSLVRMLSEGHLDTGRPSLLRPRMQIMSTSPKARTPSPVRHNEDSLHHHRLSIDFTSEGVQVKPRRPPLKRWESVEELETKTVQCCPRLEGRIVLINDQSLPDLIQKRELHEREISRIPIEEVEESSSSEANTPSK